MEIFAVPDFKNIFFWLFCGLAITFITQMVYYWLIFGKFAFRKNQALESKPLKPVSIVIVAKNEYHNLKRHLKFVLEQDYPHFEVVVVNDSSDDGSGELLKDFSDNYKHLNVFTISSNLNFFKGKKFPLALGIKAAKHDQILLTDADCKPKSDKWIFEMQKQFNGKTKIILGYGGYERKKGLLNKLIRFDTLQIALQYFSFALSGIPYMGVGRNLSYSKELFIVNKGFTKHYNISSGDDDIFVSQNATKNNVAIEYSHKSHTLSIPKTTFSSWIFQKKRHLTTGKHYKFKHLISLGLFSVTKLFFYLLVIFLLIFNYNTIPVLVIFALRLITQLIIIKKTLTKLEEKNLLLYTPFFEMFFLLFYPFIYLSNSINKNNKWK